MQLLHKLVISISILYLVIQVLEVIVHHSMEQLIDLHFQMLALMQNNISFLSMESFRSLTVEQDNQARDSLLIAVLSFFPVLLLPVLITLLSRSEQQ